MGGKRRGGKRVEKGNGDEADGVPSVRGGGGTALSPRETKVIPSVLEGGGEKGSERRMGGGGRGVKRGEGK